MPAYAPMEFATAVPTSIIEDSNGGDSAPDVEPVQDLQCVLVLSLRSQVGSSPYVNSRQLRL